MERVIKDINGKVVENAFEKAQYFATKMDMSVEAVISAMETSDCDYDLMDATEEGAIAEGMFITPLTPFEEETNEEDIEELKEINKRLILEGFEKDKKIERFEKKIEEIFAIRMRAGEENEMLKKDMESLDAQNEEKYEKIEELNEEKGELENEVVERNEYIEELEEEKDDLEKDVIKKDELIKEQKEELEKFKADYEKLKALYLEAIKPTEEEGEPPIGAMLPYPPPLIPEGMWEDACETEEEESRITEEYCDLYEKPKEEAIVSFLDTYNGENNMVGVIKELFIENGAFLTASLNKILSHPNDRAKCKAVGIEINEKLGKGGMLAVYYLFSWYMKSSNNMVIGSAPRMLEFYWDGVGSWEA